MRNLFLIFSFALCLALPARAQGLKVSFETNSSYYADDSGINVPAPENSFGSNNYLKLDYSSGSWLLGVQAEYYPSPLLGYSRELQGFGLTEKFISYISPKWSMTVGDFYEQFGSGLILRSWEDRQLGFNNSMGGARLTWNTDALSVKVLYGMPRYYLSHPLFSYASTRVGGADLALSVSDMLDWDSVFFSIGGSMVGRYEKSLPGTLAYSGRASFVSGNVSLSGEYVYVPQNMGADYERRPGSAQLIEASYAKSGFSASLALRRLINMQNRIYSDLPVVADGNTMSYVPALCQQQTYMLAALRPYVSYASGEMGGRIDMFYNVKRGTALGGRFGMKINVNASMFYTPAEALANYDYPRLSYRDINFNVEKRWNSRFRSILFVSVQEKSPTRGDRISTEALNVIVLDSQYRLNDGFSIRTEMQYLYSQEADKDWMAGLVELDFAPRWSVFASDMWNHGGSGVHYYSTGIRYGCSGLSIAASYGRNRGGMVCSGGVCRWQPAYTGGNISMSFNF